MSAGIFFGLLGWALSWSALLVNFRRQVLQARVGVWDFPGAHKVAVRLGVTFLGSALANALVTYILCCFIFTGVVLILGWGFTHWLAATVLATLGWAKIIALICAPIGNMILNKVLFCWIGPKQVIKKRYAFMVWDFIQVHTHS